MSQLLESLDAILIRTLRTESSSVTGISLIESVDSQIELFQMWAKRIGSLAGRPGHVFQISNAFQSNRSHQSEPATQLPRPLNTESFAKFEVSYEPFYWASPKDSIAIAQRLTFIRRSGEWSIILMGSLGEPWVEQLGRLCDQVYLSIPSSTGQRIGRVRKQLDKLKAAGIRISGSCVMKSAA